MSKVPRHIAIVAAAQSRYHVRGTSHFETWKEPDRKIFGGITCRF